MSSPSTAYGQCLTNDDIARLRTGLTSDKPTKIDETFRNQLLQLKTAVIDGENEKAGQQYERSRASFGIFEMESTASLLEKVRSKKEDRPRAGLCDFLKKNGWFTRSLVGEDGASAGFYLLKNFFSDHAQLQLISVIDAAMKLSELPLNEEYASFLDRLSLKTGQKQIFGTQASQRDGFLLIDPILAETRVDQRRSIYKMPPLADYMKFLEQFYRMPIMLDHGEVPALRSQVPSAPVSSASGVANDDDIVRVDSSTVDLTVRILDSRGRPASTNFGLEDFRVFEDGMEQPIGYFGKRSIPFDLVLLLDLSGSTVLKQGLIRESARRFINDVRQGDRVAIVTFTHKITVVSDLTDDKAFLLRRTSKISDTGASKVWDALEFALSSIFGGEANGRRRAVVFMTDGVDNALSFGGAGSSISFGGLLESVRKHDALVIPIYLDTESHVCSPYNNSGCPPAQRTYEYARRTLNILAEESGGFMYMARKVEDLKELYGQVLTEIGQIYTLAYSPTNGARDGRWRQIQVEVAAHPEIKIKTKRGYYAK